MVRISAWERSGDRRRLIPIYSAVLCKGAAQCLANGRDLRRSDSATLASSAGARSPAVKMILSCAVTRSQGLAYTSLLGLVANLVGNPGIPGGLRGSEFLEDQ